MAKKFKYRFESVLRLKEYNTSIARESLNFVVKLKYDKITVIEENKIKVSNAFNHDSKTIPSYLLQASANNVAYIEEENKRINEEIKELEEIINLRRIKLTEALKEEKIMIKLKDKNFSDYLYEVNREETATFDEIAGRRTLQDFSLRMEA